MHVTQLFSFPSGDPAELADLSDEDAAARFLEQFTPAAACVQRLPVRSAADACLRAAGFARGLAGLGDAALPTLRRAGVHPRERLHLLADEHDRLSSAATTREAHAEHGPTTRTTTPTGVAIFADDFQSIRRFAERDHANIVSWNRYDRGSHFAPRRPRTSAGRHQAVLSRAAVTCSAGRSGVRTRCARSHRVWYAMSFTTCSASLATPGRNPDDIAYRKESPTK